MENSTAKPIIMARHGEDAYPVGRFVLDRARALLMTRGELVRRLGYQNPHTGHIALSNALTTGSVPVEMSDRLADALAVPRDLVDAVIAATESQRQDEARARKLAHEQEYAASFRPYLRAETARRVPEPMLWPC